MDSQSRSRTYTVGIDWASRQHDVCVVDTRGTIVLRFAIAHTAAGLAELVARLARLTPPARLCVALERPSGLLVDTLLEAGFVVVPIHPNTLDASRARYTAAGAKSDPGDAYILADLLRTDGHRFPALAVPSDATRSLRAAVRTRDDLVATRVKLVNQLTALLESFWPGAAAVFPDLTSAIALAFLRRYPTPQAAHRLGEQRLAQFLHRARYAGRRSAAELLARLRSAPLGHAGSAEEATKGQLVQMLVAVLATVVEQLRVSEHLIGEQLAQHPDAAVVQSFPRTGEVNAAQILAELGDDRRRYASAAQLAAEGGVAPVTRASGKHRTVTRRLACNKRLRNALVIWAGNSRRAHPWAARTYAHARRRGCTHPHAIRILARAWVRVLWHCWQDRVPYDPAKHTTAKPFFDQAA
jgi:transposase